MKVTAVISSESLFCQLHTKFYPVSFWHGTHHCEWNYWWSL